MRDGKIVRFEEITRCPLEVQDTMLSILSEKVMAISELPDDNRMLYAKGGFNVIATANTRDRGVNEMSAALKRRFNFETVQPIPELKDEMALVQRETTKMFETANIPLTLPADIVEILTTTFWELRAAKTIDGQSLETMSTVMSTAEAISTGYAAGLHAYYYEDAKVNPDHIVNGLLGSAIKDSPDDLKKLHHYFNHAVKSRKGDAWQKYFEARKHLL
jgi:MoxR-like ATPase